VPNRNFNPDSLSESYFDRLRKEYSGKKKYPRQFEKQILIALSYYPELKNAPIIFRTKPHHSPGFTRVTWVGLFEAPEQRHFLIVISDSTEEMLQPLLFKNLPFNAQIGAIGHELAHVTDFLTKTTFGIIKHAVCNISAEYSDRFEYNTDAICIKHGLGYQLLEWSSYVRNKMYTVNWDGPDYVHKPKKRERYMNPGTIEKKISENAIYISTR
jgi:hypothetical protein